MIDTEYPELSIDPQLADVSGNGLAVARCISLQTVYR